MAEKATSNKTEPTEEQPLIDEGELVVVKIEEEPEKTWCSESGTKDAAGTEEATNNTEPKEEQPLMDEDEQVVVKTKTELDQTVCLESGTNDAAAAAKQALQTTLSKKTGEGMECGRR